MQNHESRRIALYRQMLRIRMVEEEIARRYAEQEMRCPVHLSIGQEAAAVGACACLRADDVVFSTHRCHGHYLAKGGDLTAMLAEIHGRETGCCGGRGGSMHLFDDAAGVVASVPIVGSNVPLAVGAALAFVQRGEPRVAVAFLGDAAMEEGVFHESLNLAARHRLPVVFFVENNLYSVYTRLDARQPEAPLERLATAHAMASTSVDGNDVEAVDTAMQHAVARARAGEGPTVIVAATYRLVEHCGPQCDDHLGYRPAEEVAGWAERCPLRTLATRLPRVAETHAAMRRAIAEEIEQAFAAALAAPLPPPESAAAYVYASSPAEAR